MLKIDLFDHNKIAYLSAAEMLERTGKAAVIHPTGSGKSFIGFQLCADHPDEQILWLSPSRYIFDTQLENLSQVTGGELPENIVFLTYAKLMHMTKEEMDALRPAYIILDEFHCCGAEMWGQGVRALLRTYPKAPVLGLSATNIRYLDNQRDMAKELFDGNIASEITLGEAIVRGILNPPRYVLSIFKYENDLQRYEARIRHERSRVVRDEGEKILEALRRALEKADGLDVIFDKHMTDRTGKYIVFCANKGHMDEMMKHQEWFAKVDAHPHVYSLYTADPSTSQAFADFKADDDDSHLRLLYCIDALNQGVHVEDISGVILLRPTVSPTIYKQQIGRALSASKKKDAVIFDIVLNIENLYSIGAIEEEMTIATAYYRDLGEGGEIVNEHFRVIDEVRDCLELFDKLNDVLTASWDLMYMKAAEYRKMYGNLEVPRRYVTADGYSLGGWIASQRGIRAGTMNGRLSGEQIRKLDAIGMVWESRSELSWKRNYEAAKAYYEEQCAQCGAECCEGQDTRVEIESGEENARKCSAGFGVEKDTKCVTECDTGQGEGQAIKYGTAVLDVPVDYVTPDGVSLGEWLRTLRKWKSAGVHPAYLTPERIEALDAIGMVWDKDDYYWDKTYQAAREYYEEHGNLDVPSRYVTKDGIRLGSWVSRQRAVRAGKRAGTPPSVEQIRRLDAIGMKWTDRNEQLWERYYEAAREYYDACGNLKIPKSYEVDGLKLGSWLVRQKMYARNGKLSEERAEKLAALGINNGSGKGMNNDGRDIDTWEYRVALTKKYMKENNTTHISQDTIIDGIWLGKWLAVQRKALEAGKLTPEQEKMLADVPLWTKKEQAWENAYQQAAQYYEQHGDLNISRRYKSESGFGLGSWISRQRQLRREGNLTKEQIRRLDAIGFIWDIEMEPGGRTEQVAEKIAV